MVVFLPCVDADGLGKFLYEDEVLHLIWMRCGVIPHVLWVQVVVKFLEADVPGETWEMLWEHRGYYF